jgi:hypothetical protein
VSFAFTVFDDTDNGTVENLTPVYDLLEELGFRTTKSVWPLRGDVGAKPASPSGGSAKRGEAGLAPTAITGQTLEDPEYLAFIRGLQAKGFEIALHNVQHGDATRERVELGLALYRELLGSDPKIHCNHSQNRENLYWGVDRLGFRPFRALLETARKVKRKPADQFLGHVPGSEFFWGDIAKARIQYVRNFAFDEINLNRINPSLPYADPRTPYVNYWFSSTDGSEVNRFCHAIREDQQDRLEAEGGVCIMYTHFASGFVRDGRVHPQFERLMCRLASKRGRFIAVGELLDSLLEQRGGKIPPRELRRMEWRWLREKLFKGTT